ncbi:MAG: phosphate ABC transporter permease PstA [Pseudoclavibacter sp.]|jgi:phosphate transport system permease protein
MTTVQRARRTNSLAAGQLKPAVIWGLAVVSIAISVFLIWAITSGAPNIFGVAIAAVVLFTILLGIASRIVEGGRRAVDRVMTSLVVSAFVLALVPLVSLLWTVIARGLERFDGNFFSMSMRNVVGNGGGALHAIIGTLFVTLAATIISVPIGIMAAIYLTEYAHGNPMSKLLSALVDVMTGIPSIVAGLFIAAIAGILIGPGVTTGFLGALALCVLMVPTVIRSSEEMLRLVPNELREASYALGVPKWVTVLRIVVRTAAGGLTTSVMLAISRVIGETAPLLIVAGFTPNMNYDLFSGPMMTLPVFVFDQYAHKGLPPEAFDARSWAGALTLILLAMVLNVGARLLGKLLSPKTR